MKILPWMLLLSSACIAAAPVVPPLAPKTAATVPAEPSALIVSCDPGGCWDENGVRYDAAGGGVFIRIDGRSCESIRDRMVCK
jgi:hypothetical protein